MPHPKAKSSTDKLIHRLRLLGQDRLCACRPTCFLGVPLVWEKTLGPVGCQDCQEIVILVMALVSTLNPYFYQVGLHDVTDGAIE